MVDTAFPASEALRLLEEACSAGIFFLDLCNGKMEWSHGAYMLLGEPLDAVPSMDAFRNRMHPADRVSSAELQGLVATGLPFSREFRVIHRSGRMRWLKTQTEFILEPSGQPVRMVGVVNDVTHLHEAEQAHVASQKDFRDRVMEVAPIVWSASAAGLITATEGWSMLTGRDDGAALGMGWLESVHPDDVEKTRKAWLKPNCRGPNFECELRLRDTGGRYRTVRAHAAAVFNRSNEVLHWRGLMVDLGAEAPRRIDNEVWLTGAQIRAARAILRWSVHELATASGVSASIIRRREEDEDDVPPKSLSTCKALRVALTAAGIDFVFCPDAKPGVRPAPAGAVDGQPARGVDQPAEDGVTRRSA